MKPNMENFPKLDSDYHYRIDQVEELKKAHAHLSKVFNAMVDWSENFKEELKRNIKMEREQATFAAKDFDKTLFFLHSERARVFEEILGENKE